MRTRQNINKDTDGIVTEFIGTAYDDVKLVADNLDSIQLVVDAINDLDPDSFATAAQGITADSALQPEDIDTLGELNALIAATTLIDTTDSRLSDDRDPNAHIHSSVDITDLADYLLETDIDDLAKINAIITDATLIDTTDSRLSDDRTPEAHTHPYGELTSMPTTLAGYGITDAYTMTEVDALTYAFVDLTGIPTTLAGYGITDAAPSSHVGGDIHIDWSVTGVEDVHPDRYTNTDTVYTHPATHPFSILTGLPSTLGGYGIADNVSVLANDAGYMIPADINTLVELNVIVADATLGDSADFATAAQGVLADSAIQPGVLTHDGFADYVPDEHLASSTFATAAQGALADTALQSFDVNHDLLDGYVADEHLPSATFATAAQGTLANSAVQPGELTHDGFPDYVADEHLASATFATAAQGALADTAIQTIDPDSISMDMLVDIATDTYLGRTTAGTGTIEVLTNAELKTALDLAGTNSGDQTDIVGISSTKAQFDTALSDGFFAYSGGVYHDSFSDYVADEHLPSSTFATSAQGTLADSALQSIAADSVTLDMLDDMDTASLLGRVTALTGTVEVLSVADAKTLLNLTGTNSGDQTTVVGITGTKAEFDVAVTDGNFIYVNDLLHNTFSDYVSDEHLPSSTFATAAQGVLADSALQIIASDSVTLDMMADVSTDILLGRTTALSGTVEALSPATAKTLLDLTGTNSGDQTSIVGIGGTKAQFSTEVSDGSFVYVDDLLHNTFSDYVADEHLPSSTFATAAQGTLADSALQTLAADYVTLDMMADVATDSFLGRVTTLTGTVEVLTNAQAKTALDLAGSNTGDQTSIVGISSIKTEFDDAVSDGDFVFVGDLLHDTFSDHVADEHLPSSTFATAAQGTLADSALQTLAPDFVTLDMMADVATDSFLGRVSALTGTVEVLSNADAKTALDLAGSNTGDETDITNISSTKAQFDTACSNGDFVYIGDLLHDTFSDYEADEHMPSATFATAAQGTLADSALQALAPDYVTMDMLTDIATDTFLGRTTALTGTVEILTNADAKTALDLTGVNSGDQTTIVGITGTKAEFDIAVTDGDFLFVNDLLHDTFSDYVPDEHLPSATFATAAQGTLADSALQTIAADSISMDMIADVASDTFLGRTTALTGTVEVLTNAAAKTALDLAGSNTGDQIAISDFTGTSGEFDIANTDGDFAFAAGAYHDGFSDYVPDEHLPSSTFAVAAQGVLADTAVQPADNISTLTNDSLFLAAADINTLEELNIIVGNATLGDEGDFATFAQGVTADTASQPGHTHSEVDITNLKAYLQASDINTLLELNALIDDADLIDTADSRLSDDRDPNAHIHYEVDILDLQNYLASTDIETLALLNAVVGDATLIDTADSRLSDDRDPTAHTHLEAQITDLGTYLPAIAIADLAGLNATVLDATLGDASDFATAAQGTLAGTAVQPADIGTAAAEDVGYFATAAQGTLADSALQAIDPDSVTLDMLADIATDSFLGRVTAVTGTVEVLSNAAAKTALDLTGTNSGDQTDITAISSTAAQFDTACSDTDFAYAAGVYHDGFSDYVADEHLPSATFATAAQGALADTALQDAGAWATDAQGTLADSAIQPADIDGRMLIKGDYNASTNTPDLDTTPIAAVKGDAYRTSVAGSFFGTIDLEVGDILVALQDTPVLSSHWAVINKNIDTSAFATSAQGTTADSALQAADISTLAELNAIVTETLIDDTHAGLGPDEGDTVFSTGEPAGHILTAVGDNSSVWAVPAPVEGADLAATAIAVGDVITADGIGGITWEEPVVYTTALTTLGDIEGFDGAARGRLPVGIDGQYLAADSGETLGLIYVTPPTMTAAGMTVVYVTTGSVIGNDEDIFSDSGLTHSLPATPVAGERCVVRDFAKDAGSNNITIQRNGSTIMGAATDLVMDEDGQIVTFMCDAAGNWIYSSVSDVPNDPAALIKIIDTATYTILEADNGYRLMFDYATAIAVDVPDGLSLGHNFRATQVGAGVPTFTPGTDTINGAGTAITPTEQWGSVYMVQYDYADWLAEYTKAGSYLSLP